MSKLIILLFYLIVEQKLTLIKLFHSLFKDIQGFVKIWSVYQQEWSFYGFTKIINSRILLCKTMHIFRNKQLFENKKQYQKCSKGSFCCDVHNFVGNKSEIWWQHSYKRDILYETFVCPAFSKPELGDVPLFDPFWPKTDGLPFYERIQTWIWYFKIFNLAEIFFSKKLSLVGFEHKIFSFLVICSYDWVIIGF
jgi:hypothetical protein